MLNNGIMSFLLSNWQNFCKTVLSTYIMKRPGKSIYIGGSLSSNDKVSLSSILEEKKS